MAVRNTPLCTAYRIDPETRVVALVGAGGKTSLMYSLAGELVSLGRRVVTTTTTKIFPPRPDQSPGLVLLSEDPSLSNLAAGLSRHGHVTLASSLLKVGKVDGVSEETVCDCLRYADSVLVEADGAAGRSVKAPEKWEPVIPRAADLVIPVVGLDCIGARATEDLVFRLERFLAVTGLESGETISPESIGLLLGHPEGGIRGVPERSRVVPFLNKVDLLSAEWDVQELVAAMLRGSGDRIRRIVVGKLNAGVKAVAYGEGENVP
jgi:probable selenium-dependent hydroxylase accessory protein YqeC